MIMRMVGGWVFLMVPAHPGSPLTKGCKTVVVLCITSSSQLAKENFKNSLEWQGHEWSSMQENSRLKHHHHTTVLWPFFRDHPGEPVPEENFWTLWCKGRLTEADTQTIWLGATSAHLHHPAIFSQTGCPSCRPTNSVKALKAHRSLALRWLAFFPAVTPRWAECPKKNL